MFSTILKLFCAASVALTACKTIEDLFLPTNVQTQETFKSSAETVSALKSLTPLGQKFLHSGQAGSQVVGETGILFSILETPLSKTALIYIVDLPSCGK